MVMTEARDVEEIVADAGWRIAHANATNAPVVTLPRYVAADLISDWRAKKAEIERLQSVVRFKERVKRVGAKYTGSSTTLSVPAAELMAQQSAEAMRAKCEEIVRGFHDPDDDGWEEAIDTIADAIATLKP